MGEELPLVLVTGASGFIASHVIADLLAEKKYRIRGTVRSLSSETATKPLKEAFPEVELVEADLSKDDGWKEAAAGCTYVHHIASPGTLDRPRDPNTFIRPAIEGTKRVLQACVDAGTVKRVVMTSSSAAVSAGVLGNPGRPADHVYTSEDWTDPEMPKLPPYEASKAHAEKTAWEFVKNLEDDKKIELVVINPTMVFGPILLTRPSGSHEVLSVLLKRDFFAVPNLTVPCVDVRDVKKAHVAAMTKAEAAGKRYILWSETLPMRDIAQILADEFSSQGYNVPTSRLPDFVLWFAKFLSNQAKVIYEYLGTCILYDNSPLKQDLGIEPIDIKKSVIDSGYSIIEKGIVPKKQGFKGRDETGNKE